MARFLKVIVNIILLAAIAVAAALLVPPVLGVTTVIVDSTDMVTNLPLGSVTYATDKDATDLQVNDVILNNSDSGNNVYVIKSEDISAGSYDLQDKYDSTAEPVATTLRNNVSVVKLTVPFIAYAVIAMQSMEGQIIIGLVVVFIIILFILAELWKKSDEEEEEALENEELGLEDDEFKSKRQLKKEAKARKKAQKADEKARKKAAKKGGYDYEEETPLDTQGEPLIQEPIEKPIEEHTPVDAIIESVADELAQGVGSVTGAEPAQNSLSQEKDDREADAELKLKIPNLTVDELLKNAVVEGDEPEIIEDKKSGITLLDYTEALKKQED